MDEMEAAKPRPVESTEDFKLRIAAIDAADVRETNEEAFAQTWRPDL
jgi:hypothetical protein